jgi:hypothetical protein
VTPLITYSWFLIPILRICAARRHYIIGLHMFTWRLLWYVTVQYYYKRCRPSRSPNRANLSLSRNTLGLKIHECAVRRFESSIICAMKKWHKSSVTSYGIAVALKPKQTTKKSRIDPVTRKITNKKCACHPPPVLKGLKTQKGTPRVICWQWVDRPVKPAKNITNLCWTHSTLRMANLMRGQTQATYSRFGLTSDTNWALSV